MRDQVKQKMAEEREAAIAKAKQIREAKQAAAEARSAALAEAERLAGLARPLQRRTRRWPHRWKVNHLSFLSLIYLPQLVSFICCYSCCGALVLCSQFTRFRNSCDVLLL